MFEEGKTTCSAKGKRNYTNYKINNGFSAVKRCYFKLFGFED